MRHLILFTLLIVQVIAFGYAGLGDGPGFESAGHPAIYFVGFLQDSVHGRIGLILLTLAASLPLCARTLDLSLLAMAAMFMALMSRFAPGTAVNYGALPVAVLGAAALAALHAWLVGSSLRRSVVITLLLLVVYRLLALIAIADDPEVAFGLTPNYFERFANPDLYWPIIFAVAFVVGIAGFIARRAAAAKQHPLDPDPAPAHESLPTILRIALFSLAGALVGTTAIVQTASDLTASATWGLGDTGPMLGALVIGGGFAAVRRAPTTAIVLAGFNLAVLYQGLKVSALAHGESLPFDPQELFGPVVLVVSIACFVFDREPSQTEPTPAEA